MKSLRNEINTVRNSLMNYAILCLLIITLPATVFSTLHLISDGYLPDYGISILETLFILSLYIFRNKIGNRFKAHVITISFIVGGLAGNLFFGSVGDQFLAVIGIALITLFYGKKPGIIYFFIVFSGFIILQILFSEHIVERNLNYNEYFNDIRNWIISIITLIVTAIILIFSISFFYHFLINLVKDLEKKNNELDILNTAYKDVMAKLETSEKKYKGIFKTLKEGMILTDEEGNIIDCNQATEDILGIPKETILTINLHSKNFNLVYPDLSPIPNEECPGVKTLVNGSPIYNFEVGMQNGDNIKWLILNSATLKAEGYGVFLTLNDISEIKKLEKEQIIFNHYFETFLEHITDYVCFKDREGEIVFCSQSLARITGHCYWKDLIGKNYDDIFPLDVAKNFKGEDDIVYQTGQKLLGSVNTFYDNNSELRYEQTNKIPLFDDNKNVVGIISISRDITEILREKELIKEKEEKINLLLNSTYEGIYGVDLEGRCTFINKSGVNMLGYSNQEEVLGQNIHDLIHHTDSNGVKIAMSECKINRAFHLRKGMHSDQEIFWKKDNMSFDVEYFSFPQIHKDEVVGCVVTFIDITQRKESDKKIQLFTQELQKLNSDKDKFIKILAHDLKAPFHSILGLSEFIIKNIEDIDAETVKEYTQEIYSSSEKTYSLLEEVLFWLKVQTGKLTPLNTEVEIKSIVMHVIDLLQPTAQQKNIQLECLIPNGIYVYFDINILRTILRNLISNSIKFTPEGGKIEVEHQQIENHIQLIVKDNGQGMSEDKKNKLFTSQINASYQGTQQEMGSGVGLTIVKELLDVQNQEIWVETEEGKGSKFIFSVGEIAKND